MAPRKHFTPTADVRAYLDALPSHSQSRFVNDCVKAHIMRERIEKESQSKTVAMRAAALLVAYRMCPLRCTPENDPCNHAGL